MKREHVSARVNSEIVQFMRLVAQKNNMTMTKLLRTILKKWYKEMHH